MVEKFRAWSECGGNVESRFTKDELLTHIMLYWATESIGTSFFPYYDYANASAMTWMKEGIKNWVHAKSRQRSRFFQKISVIRHENGHSDFSTCNAGPKCPRADISPPWKNPSCLLGIFANGSAHFAIRSICFGSERGMLAWSVAPPTMVAVLCVGFCPDAAIAGNPVRLKWHRNLVLQNAQQDRTPRVLLAVF